MFGKKKGNQDAETLQWFANQVAGMSRDKRAAATAELEQLRAQVQTMAAALARIAGQQQVLDGVWGPYCGSCGKLWPRALRSDGWGECVYCIARAAVVAGPEGVEIE